MKIVTLMQVEAAGIQDYIFGSNNLQQNIGASEIVKLATTGWILETFDLFLRHNAHWNIREDRLEFKGSVGTEPSNNARLRVAHDAVDVEVIYAGGGNALLLFAGPKSENARKFTTILSERLLKEAVDLRLTVDAIEMDWDKDSLAQKHACLREQAAKQKMARKANAPLNGLSVTAGCVFTGQPVAGRDPDGRLVARSVLQKLAKTQESNDRLHEILPQVRKYFYEFTNNFDQFGQKDESSYIAVVHIDGNQMGERFRKLADQHLQQEQNETYIDRLYNLSLSVQNLSTAALREVADTLIRNEQDGLFGGMVPVHTENGQTFLPFRPLVFGGDDATFVCEGRLGLSLAARYLRALAVQPLFAEQADSPEADRLYARAGVSVVKSHFPFSRAYELAGDLCQSAKDAISDRIPTKQGCILDWHFSTSGIISSLGKIRAQEYTASSGQSLLMRPLWVPVQGEKSMQHWQTFDNFDQIANTMRESEDWAGHRNKIKALRDALRDGREAVALFLKTYRQPSLPEIPGQPDMPDKGWQDKDCGYFDVVEALDFYVPLQYPGEES
jgi:hypothetical protein